MLPFIIFQHPDREAVVCMPQGAHPSVEAFLALHSVLFPIRSLATIDVSQVNKVSHPYMHVSLTIALPSVAMTHHTLLQLGVVDASTKDRLGAGQALLGAAKEVCIIADT